MTDHTPNSKVSRLEVVSTGARRRWILEEKRRIVAEFDGLCLGAEALDGQDRPERLLLHDAHRAVAVVEDGGREEAARRELGPTGLAEYQELKHIWTNTAPKEVHWFAD